MAAVPTPIIEVNHVSKFFGSVVALRDVSLSVHAGEVLCLLGDNGAGKSTLIKILSGVHAPTEGEIRVDGVPVTFASPRKALDLGIATVYQDLAMVPLMSIARNFFMGREPMRGRWVFKRSRLPPGAAVWPLRRSQRSASACAIQASPWAHCPAASAQCVAIARAVYFGARLLILDEPTSALGVKQASLVLRYISRARASGIGGDLHHPQRSTRLPGG